MGLQRSEVQIFSPRPSFLQSCSPKTPGWGILDTKRLQPFSIVIKTLPLPMNRYFLSLIALLGLFFAGCGTLPEQDLPDDGGFQISAADSSRGNRRRRDARDQRRAARISSASVDNGSGDGGSSGSGEDSGDGSGDGSGDSGGSGGSDSGGGLGSAFTSAFQSGNSLVVTVSNADSEDATLLFHSPGGSDSEVIPSGSSATVSFVIPPGSTPLESITATIDLQLEGGISLETMEVAVVEPVNLPATAPVMALSAARVTALKELSASNNSFRNKVNAKIIQVCDGYLAENLSIPASGGAWVELYMCPDHGVKLNYVGPGKHRCPKDGSFHSDPSFDAVIATHTHYRLAEEVLLMGLAYQLTDTLAYAERARDIVVAYGDAYPGMTLHDRLGNTGASAGSAAGKTMCQTLDEAEWMMDLALGYDLIRSSGLVDAAAHQTLVTNLFVPCGDLLAADTKGIHNIQNYLNSASFFAYLHAGESEKAKAAIEDSDGFEAQLRDGIMEDGTWLENSFGYQYFMLRATIPMARAIRNLEIDVDTSALKSLLIAPYAIAAPDGTLPMLNDGSLTRLSPSNGGDGIYKGSLYEEGVNLFNSDVQIAEPLVKWNRTYDFRTLAFGEFVLPAASVGTQEDALLPTMGVGVMRVGSPASQSTILMDFGPHGGHHGHPDKLGIVAWLGGRPAIGESGSIGYGTLLYKGWYKRTLAHSTILVDGQDHEHVGGELVVFDSDDKRIVASANTAAEGVDLTRMVHLTPDGYLLDLYQASSDSSHFYDYVIHSYGDVGSVSTSLALSPTTSTGVSEVPYSVLDNMQSARTSDDFDVTFSDDNGSHTIRFFGEAGTQVLFAEAPWFPAGDTHVMVIIRRQGTKVSFGMASAYGATFPADLSVSVSQSAPSITYTSGGQSSPKTLNFDAE